MNTITKLMDFEKKIENKYYNIGKIIGIYLSFLLFFSIVYYIFFKHKFTFSYILLISFLISSIYLIFYKGINERKNKATF